MFLPELWPDVLHEFGKIAEAGATLFVAKGESISWTASKIARESAAACVKGGWFWHGELVARMFGAKHSGFLTDLDLFTPDELDLEPIYRECWRPRGAAWMATTAIEIPTGEKLALVLNRRTERGPVEREFVQKLDELRPHPARSALLSARSQLERARVASETLAALGLPALVLDERGKVLAANSLAETLTGYLHWRARDRVSLKDRAADQLLRDAIAAIDMAGGTVRSFPVRDISAEAMMVAHVVPIRLSARDNFVRCAAALILTPVTAPQAPPVELVQSLFDLTPAEARVACSLANTTLTQLRGVMEKTGCHRQAEVVALLTTISPARLTHSA
jgi:PAS domain-containing protein